MCLILTGTHPRYPLVVAANRDEFRSRPSAPLHRWEGPGLPGGAVYAGRDLQAGGTWMAVTPSGAFAALTNFREAAPVIGGRSRGRVPMEVLAAPSLEAGVRGFHAGRALYGGMHVLAGDASGFWYASNRGTETDQAVEQLPPGFYAICNGARRDLWPKMRGGLEAMRGILERESPLSEDGLSEDGLIAALMEALSDDREAEEAELPQTGVSREWERALSARCVDRAQGTPYGTRTSTVLLVGAQTIRLAEWTRPPGAVGWAAGTVGSVDLRWAVENGAGAGYSV